MSQISAFRSGTSVMVRYDDVARTIVHETEEDARGTFRAVMKAKEDPSEENLGIMKKLLEPDYKIKENEWVEKDRYGNYYLAGYKVPITNLLKKKLQEYIEDGIDLVPLVNFWKLLLLNPDTVVRDSLFNFAEHFGFPITDRGYFIAYKSVAFAGKKHEDLGILISSRYVYLRAEGKNPDDYNVYCITTGKNKEYEIVFKDDCADFLEEFTEEKEVEVSLKDVLAGTYPDMYFNEEGTKAFRMEIKSEVQPELLGTLTEMFKNLPALFDNEESQFTDHHSRSMDIRLGVPVSMDRGECDNDPERTCSSGLHVGTPQYASTFGGSGSYILACLVNPMNVVAVPNDYNGQKMRCCEYLPYAVCETTEDGGLKEIDTKYFEDDYVNYEIKDLEKKLDEMIGRNCPEEELQQVRNRLIQIQA